MLPKEAPKQTKIIWYNFKTSLPEIAPEQPFGPAKTPRGEKDPAGRTVIAHSAEPSSNKQLIWQPDRPDPIPADVPTPNLVVVEPKAPKPALKQFTPPPPPPAPHGKPQAVALAEPVPTVQAPKLPLNVDTLGLDLAQQDPALLPRRPRFVAPSQPTKTTAEAPTQRLPEAPSSAIGGATGVGLTAVIVGLDPAPGPSPPGSRPGEFSRAPAAGSPSSGAATRSDAPKVPGLLAHSSPGAAPAEPTPAPPNAPIPERHLLKDLVLPAINRTMSVPLRPSSRVLPASVETRFPGRNVYTLVVPGPNLPEYTGDWILWFSERHPPEENAARVLAPIPARKFYLTGMATPPADSQESGTIQLASMIDRSGHVSGTRVLRGGTTDEAFRAKAIEELETWEFQPALRNGEPIDVDIVVEISFRLPVARSAR
jgi:TonB family protein